MKKRWFVSEKFQKFLRIALISAVAAQAAFVSSMAYQLRGNKSVKPYIEKNLTKIIHQQEQVMGIKHFGIPKVVCDLPEDIPSIVKIAVSFYGLYRPNEDTVYLITGPLTTPENTLEDYLGKTMNFINFNTTKSAEHVLYHELGHYYVDKFAESLGLEGDVAKNEGEIIPKRLVSEGIAVYFERKTLGKEETKPPEYLDRLEDFVSDNDFLYNGGYQLVKPILDKYGDKGIAYLIIMPPTMLELNHLSKYQEEAMKFLEETE